MDNITGFIYPSVMGMLAMVFLVLLLLVCCIRWRPFSSEDAYAETEETSTTRTETVSVCGATDPEAGVYKTKGSALIDIGSYCNVEEYISKPITPAPGSTLFVPSSNNPYRGSSTMEDTTASLYSPPPSYEEIINSSIADKTKTIIDLEVPTSGGFGFGRHIKV